MNRPILPSALLALTLAFPQLARAQDAATDPGLYLPAQTSAVATVRNMSVFLELDETHPIKKMAAHPAFSQIIEAFAEDMRAAAEDDGSNEEEADWKKEMRTDLGVEEGELARLFPGQITLAGHLDVENLISAFKVGAMDLTGNQANLQTNLTVSLTDSIGGVLIVDTTASEDRLAELVENLVAAIKKEMEDSDEGNLEDIRMLRETVDGQSYIKIEFKPVDKDWYPVNTALVGERYIVSLSPNEEYFDEVVRRVQEDGAESGSLANDTGYLDSRDRLLDSDFFAFVALEGWMKTFDEAIAEAYAALSAEGPNPMTMMVPEANVRRVLGLNDFKRYTIAGKIQPDGLEFMQEIAFAQRTGIFSAMFDSYGKGGLELPDFDPTGITSVSVTSFDISAMMEKMMAFVPQISPMLGGMMDMQLMNLETQGLKLRSGILPGLGEGMTVIEAYANPTPAPDQLPSQIYMFNCDDPTGLAAALEELRGFVGKQLPLEENETRQFMGVTVNVLALPAEVIQQMSPASESGEVSYAFIDDKLVVAMGEEKIMDHTISSLKKKGNDLASHEAIGEGWKRWEMDNLISYAYADVATVLKALLWGMREGADVSVQVNDEDADVTGSIAKALEDFPDLSDMQFFLIGKGYQTEDAMISRSFFGEKPQE